MPTPRKRLLRRTEPGLPSSMGSTMYATTAMMLPTIDSRKSPLTVRSACFSFFGSRSVTLRRSGGKPGLGMRSARTTAVAGAGAAVSCFSTSEPAAPS